MKLQAPVGATKKRKLVGRGQGSGRGCTSGRGSNGQKSRSGYSRQIGFEGGQMPLARRLPKRGFNNEKFEHEFQIVNIKDLERFGEGERVDYEALRKHRLVNGKGRYVKLLGEGELKKKLTVVVHKASKKAREQVEKAGGKVEIVEQKGGPGSL
jgi:large subunit ribosomal protein L15